MLNQQDVFLTAKNEKYFEKRAQTKLKGYFDTNGNGIIFNV